MEGIVFRLKQHDTAPALRATITDAGTPVDLTPATGIKVIGSQNGTLLFSRSVTGTSQGVVTMPWSVGDTSVPGLISIELEVSWPGSPPTVQTFPASGTLTVLVDRDLG
jgi:hypothetical protein